MPLGLWSLRLAFPDLSVLDVAEKPAGSSPQSLCPQRSMAAAADLFARPFVFEKQPAFLLLTPASLAPNRMPSVVHAQY